VLDSIFFYVFAAMTLGGALLTVTRTNAVHSAIALIVSLMGVAGIYLLQSAEFLFVVQIVLYIGGIMLLFLFVIMLVNLDEAAKQAQFNGQWILSGACLMGIAAEVAWFMSRGGSAGLPWAQPAAGNTPAAVAAATATGNTQLIADSLFSQYLLPFEVVSLLLLVADAVDEDGA